MTTISKTIPSISQPISSPHGLVDRIWYLFFLKLEAMANMTVESVQLPTGSQTLDPRNGRLQWISNIGAFTISAPDVDGEIILQVANGSGAGAITWSGFQPSTPSGSSFTTTNGHEFLVTIVRINGITTATNKALQ